MVSARRKARARMRRGHGAGNALAQRAAVDGAQHARRRGRHGAGAQAKLRGVGGAGQARPSRARSSRAAPPDRLGARTWASPGGRRWLRSQQPLARRLRGLQRTWLAGCSVTSPSRLASNSQIAAAGAVTAQHLLCAPNVCQVARFRWGSGRLRTPVRLLRRAPHAAQRAGARRCWPTRSLLVYSRMHRVRDCGAGAALRLDAAEECPRPLRCAARDIQRFSRTQLRSAQRASVSRLRTDTDMRTRRLL